QVQVEQTLDLKVAAYPTNRFQGKVYFVAPAVDPNLRTTLVKAQAPNPRQELKPGMFANLDLSVNVRENSIVIPEAALSQILDGERANVFTVGVSNTVQLKSVKLGVRLPGQVEILGGLEAGETVIVEGVQKVGPGARVKVAAAEPAQANGQKGAGA